MFKKYGNILNITCSSEWNTPQVSFIIYSISGIKSDLKAISFPIDWSDVWGWASEGLLHINGHCLHLHMEKGKQALMGGKKKKNSAK